MTNRKEPDVAFLRSWLREGIGSRGREGGLSARLGLPQGADHLSVSRTLIRELVEAQIAAIRIGGPGEGLPAGSRAPVTDSRTSFLVRLGTETEEPSLDIGRMDDLRTLLALLRAGTLIQRRAAGLRIGELLSDAPRSLPHEQVRRATDTVKNLRKFDIAYELSSVCADLPGADGRRARNGRRAWDRLQQEVAVGLLSFWDGQESAEPIRELQADQRIQLLVRCRDLPDTIVYHLAATLEDADGKQDRTARRALIATLQNAGDPRLLPSLRSLLEGSETDLLIPAARALARIDDARVRSILRARYERTTAAEVRLVLAGALAMAGDNRGADYVREVVRAGDEALLPLALEALGALGTVEDVQAVAESLDGQDPNLVRTAVRSLERIGDSRALAPLRRVHRETDRSGLRAAIEEAEAAILARMELLGEEAPDPEAEMQTFDTAKMAVQARRQDPAGVRVRAHLCHWFGSGWLLLGALERAVNRFEEAAALRPGWVAPVLSLAMAFARHGRSAQSLSTFRRALEIDRDSVEADAHVVRTLAQAFLRRAEAVERDGREDIAYGLLEEALSLDLRKAPSGLRFALGQRHEALRMKAG